MKRSRKPLVSGTFVCAVLVALVAGMSGARAQDSRPESRPARLLSVLELYTSQGCSSCPAADALFVDMARDPSLLVLTLPVDYWDYLGWKDTLAHSAFSQRQRSYAKARGDGQIYTPQAIIDGAAHTVGSDRQAMNQIVKAHQSSPLPLDVGISEHGSLIRITVSGTLAGTARAGSIWILPVARRRSVSIQRGENRGREVSYANVVRGLMRVGEWRGEAMTLEVPASLVKQADADTFAVLIHSDDAKIGRVIGAAKAPGFAQ